jgi:hypothetical protein
VKAGGIGGGVNARVGMPPRSMGIISGAVEAAAAAPPQLPGFLLLLDYDFPACDQSRAVSLRHAQ